MSHVHAYVRFADGQVLLGEYDGTTDSILPRLFATKADLWSAWRTPEQYAPAPCTCGGTPEPCEYFEGYGGGTGYLGHACRKCMVLVGALAEQPVPHEVAGDLRIRDFPWRPESSFYDPPMHERPDGTLWLPAGPVEEVPLWLPVKSWPGGPMGGWAWAPDEREPKYIGIDPARGPDRHADAVIVIVDDPGSEEAREKVERVRAGLREHGFDHEVIAVDRKTADVISGNAGRVSEGYSVAGRLSLPPAITDALDRELGPPPSEPVVETAPWRDLSREAWHEGPNRAQRRKKSRKRHRGKR